MFNSSVFNIFLLIVEWLTFLSQLLIFTFPKGPTLEMKNHTVKKLVKIEKCLAKKKITTPAHRYSQESRQLYGTGAVCASTVFVDQCSNEDIKLRFH